MDALLQNPAWSETLETDVVAPLESSQRRRREARSRKAHATRVDFFTMVRGENPK